VADRGRRAALGVVVLLVAERPTGRPVGRHSRHPPTPDRQPATYRMASAPPPRGERRSWPYVLVAGVLAAALTGGCSADVSARPGPVPSRSSLETFAPPGQPLTASPGSTRPATAGSSAAPAARPGSAQCTVGMLLVVHGKDARNAQLAQVDPCTGHSKPVTNNTRISNIGATGGQVVVGAAPSDVDQVFRLDQGRLVPVTGRTAPAGLTPAVDSHGAAVYGAVDNTTTPYTVHLSIGSRNTVIHRGLAPQGPFAFTGPGPVLDIEDPSYQNPLPGAPTSPQLLRLTPAAGGAYRVDLTRAVTVAPVNGLAWLPGLSVAAISGGQNLDRAYLLNLDTGKQTALPAGWRVLVALPGSNRLLLVRQAHLGVLEAAHPTGPVQPLTLPSSLGGIYGAAPAPR